jgi:hypothetical protein
MILTKIIDRCVSDREFFTSKLYGIFTKQELRELLDTYGLHLSGGFYPEMNPVHNYIRMMYNIGSCYRAEMIHAFLTKIENVPLLINEDNGDVQFISQWRLKIAR